MHEFNKKHMHRYFIFAILIYLSATDLLAQQQLQQYSRVKINLTGRDINDLSRAGIETDHGLFVKNKFFISDFSNEELEIIKKLNFETEVLVADVVSYYALANRPSELTKSAKRGSGCGGQTVNEYNYTRPTNYKDGSMGGYPTYSEMLLVLDSMVAKFPHLISHPQNIDTLTTYEGNRLFYVKLSDQVAEDEISEPNVLYTALHHAREPNGLSQMLYYMWYLLENYGIDPIVTRIVNETQLYFVPCVNPDGYKLNESYNPLGGGLWRKNMWRDTSGALKGVDLNRNYGHFWGFDNIGSSNNPNSQTYRGTDGFSEPETKSIRNLCTKIEFSMALNYHTFGNYLIHPWGYSDEPTDEDKLYKIIAKEMNRENQFTVGTGTETVGYVVNGDSDDWMYGANDEKKAIFAFTPEVGPSFWPPQVDIDYLNRSCMWMNLSTALMTLSHYTAEEEVKSSYFSPENKSVFINVSRAGMKDGKCQITLKSATPGVMVEEMTREISLNRGENVVLEYKLDIEDSVSEGELLLTLDVKNGDVVTSSTITKSWINSNFIDIKYDSINNVGSFTSDYWTLTEQTYFSSPACLTDSPDGQYLDNFESEVILGGPIDLSKTSQAILSFYTKWDIEKGYDYVQIQASSNNRDFIPLCGLHTVYGTQNQAFNSPLFDGTQADWVREEMDLTYFVSQPKVWIRAIFKSDEGVRKDGFYMDDLRVQVVPIGTTAVTDERVDVRLYPTISDGKQLIYLSGFDIEQVDLKFAIYDISGRELADLPIVGGTVDISNTMLPSGLYMYKLVQGQNVKGNGKFVIN